MANLEEFERLRKKVFDHSKEFKGFKFITKERICFLEGKIEVFNKHIKNMCFSYTLNPKNLRYKYALGFIFNDSSLSYDEKIYFLIKVLDPELEMYKLSLQFTNITNSKIECEESDYSKIQLRELQLKQQNDMLAYIKKEVGIGEPKLLYYEKYYFYKFLQSQELIFDVKRDYTRAFFDTFFIGENTLEMPDEDLERILECANEYISVYGMPSLNDLAYQLTIQPKVIGLKTLKEKVIFMIYVLDKNLKAYQIYDSCCTWDQVKKECLNQLGFYDKDFINAEVLYDKTLAKSLSEWQ